MAISGRPRGVPFINWSSRFSSVLKPISPRAYLGTLQPPNIVLPVVVKGSYARAGPFLHPHPHLHLYFLSPPAPPSQFTFARHSLTLWIMTATMRYCTLSSSRPRVTRGSAPTPTILQLASVCAMMQVLTACSHTRTSPSSPLNVLCALWI